MQENRAGSFLGPIRSSDPRERGPFAGAISARAEGRELIKLKILDSLERPARATTRSSDPLYFALFTAVLSLHVNSIHAI